MSTKTKKIKRISIFVFLVALVIGGTWAGLWAYHDAQGRYHSTKVLVAAQKLAAANTDYQYKHDGKSASTIHDLTPDYIKKLPHLPNKVAAGDFLLDSSTGLVYTMVDKAFLCDAINRQILVDNTPRLDDDDPENIDKTLAGNGFKFGCFRVEDQFWFGYRS